MHSLAIDMPLAEYHKLLGKIQNINSAGENTYRDGHVAVALRTLIKETARRMLGFAGD